MSVIGKGHQGRKKFEVQAPEASWEEVYVSRCSLRPGGGDSEELVGVIDPAFDRA